MENTRKADIEYKMHKTRKKITSASRKTGA